MNINPENWSSSAALIVAFCALVGVFVTNAVTLYINYRQDRSKRKQQLDNKREKAYIECIRILNESQGYAATFDYEGNVYLKEKNLRPLMSTLERAVPLLAIIEANASYPSTKIKINTARNELLRCTLEVLREEVNKVVVMRDPSTPVSYEGRLEHGLSVAIGAAFSTVLETSSYELVS